ncbi:MAG: epoxide hydrolase 4 [Solirubrobacteraceae bacterium]|nr:epoxide hydrolase 4 [Solirubrobacteraceae bacterium]
MSDGRTELREGYADVGDVRLHYVEAGEGPLVVLLHGFPEFWYGWRLQIAPLAAAGFRVVAPDLRGYNLSSKPDGVAAYTAGKLAADVRDLIRERAIALEETFDRVAAAQGRPAVRVTELKPLPPKDPNGTAAVYAVIAWVFGATSAQRCSG